MWREAALALKSYPHVIGYDIMVEPEIPTRQATEWNRFASRLIHAIFKESRGERPFARHRIGLEVYAAGVITLAQEVGEARPAAAR